MMISEDARNHLVAKANALQEAVCRSMMRMAAEAVTATGARHVDLHHSVEGRRETAEGAPAW